MWSQLLLCCLIGFAAASQNGWQSNMEYEYKVQGRTFTALPDIANQYAGIAMKAKLIVRPEGDEVLMAKIANAQYAQVHANLPEGWKSDIPERHLQYKQLQLSEKPFQILLKNGVVRDVIVDRDVHNWEANIIKAIVSQVQLDTQGENVIKAHLNQLPEGDDNSAVFKTMEDTVTGTYETLYDITPLPEYVLQSQPELVPMPELKKNGEVIEIIKTKNFSRSEENLGYYYGLGGMGQFEPNTNQMGDFFLRSAMSRVIVTGSLKRFTIQSASTTNKIIIAPTLNSEQKGMVVSHLNLTLRAMQPASGSFEQPQQGQKLGSLTYTFNTPFSGNHEARQGAKRSQQEYMYSSEEDDQQYRRQQHRHPRSVQQSEESVESQEQWAQEEAKLNQPLSPSSSLYIGYKGKSIKSADKINVVEAAHKLAQKIAKEIQHPQEIQKEQTLASYVILSSVAKIMNEKEMQQVTDKLYTKEQRGQQAEAWYAYRDAIAEAGTGPALLTVQQWIDSKKIQHEEAAEVVAVMADSVRQPTDKYIRAFYQLAIKNEQVQRQHILNDTAILSFTRLVRKVIVDKLVAHNQYPVHSFGSFRTQEGQQFVAQELIPHLKDQLHQAVKEADSHKVLVYIRALGNVAHKEILAVFEPYLEGEKQCSQFQRMQMVLALDKLVKTHPKVARSVLYKIYQNAGEEQYVRVAAVYQLMRTAPPASMLQRMAEYTNIDTDEQVNAAVKATIETAAQLEGAEFEELASNARAAQPLLTKNTYGIQYSQNFLRSFVAKEMNLFYKQTAQIYGSHDSVMPKGFKYALRAGLGGARRQLINVQGMVSSVEELTNVFQRQSHQYQKHQEQQQQGFQQAKQQKWSAEYIAEKLNIKNPEREQLEADLLVQLAGGVTRYFAINNQTIEMLPQLLRQVEDMLREGEDFHYTKYINRNDVAISFPTEMALPFVYTLDAPTLLHFQGKIRATAEPKMSNGQAIRMPETITAHAEIRALVSARLQAKIGFVTPFDHQQYIAGYDKNVQINLPIKSQYEIDLKTQQVQAQFQPIEQDKNVQVFHYSSWPYTAKHDILSLEPVAQGPHTKIIYAEQQPQSQFNQLVGKQTGMAFRVQYISEQKFADSMWAYEQLQRHNGDAIAFLLAPLYDETIQHTKAEVTYDAQESSARKVQMRLGYESEYQQEQGHGNAEVSQFAQLPRESKARQQQFAKIASAGIASSTARVVDLSVEFDGHNKAEYVATAAIASSPVDEKARALFYYKKHAAQQSYEVAFSAKAHIPNTNGLDYQYALQFDPTTTAQAELAFGQDLQSATKVQLHAKLQKSETRKQYLKNSERAQECHEEMKQGNKQLPACANMTAEANLLDRVNVHVQVEHLSAKARNATQKIYNALRAYGYYNLDENTVDPQTNEKDNQMTIQARFEPDFEAVNVTIRTHKMESHFDQIRVNQWAKQVFGFHPVFRMTDRVMSEALELDTYRPICVVDQTAANTFDNKTYRADLGNAWTVMMQYVPQFARASRHQERYSQQQEEQQLEQYSVLVRDASNGQQKEVKMTIRTPHTEGQTIEIDLKPQGQCGDNKQCAKVVYNGQEIQYDDKKVRDIMHGLVKVYALPDGDVKIEVRQAYYIIYDGERVKLTATHDKLRGSVRGLCGTYTGEYATDFLAPEYCIYENEDAFVAAYQVEQAEGRQGRYNYKQQGKQSQTECVKPEIQYANVISEQDAGRAHQQYHSRQQQQWQQHHGKNAHARGQNGDGQECLTHQTQYKVIESDDEICFTIRPQPVCRKHCNVERMSTKKVPVHCVAKSSVSKLWKQQIENGASPDFSHKSVSKDISMEIQTSCTRY
ncbi:vitellogenin-like [Atheta coriaria]|uniref:vitellogenin-like n=1 Tax=Dalotia coriaria TaxID=877792 RepID=UPI0031F3ACD9